MIRNEREKKEQTIFLQQKKTKKSLTFLNVSCSFECRWHVTEVDVTISPNLYLHLTMQKPDFRVILSGQRRPRSDCASAQSDQSLRCPLTEELNTPVHISKE